MAESTEEKVSLELVSAPVIEKRIFVIRKRQVVLDEDLTDLYCVETKRLIQQVKRNLRRFSDDFISPTSRLQGLGGRPVAELDFRSDEGDAEWRSR